MYTQEEAIVFYKVALLQATKSQESFTEFLETAAQHYKHNALTQVMIYAQQPEAQFVASKQIWNRLGGVISLQAEPIVSLQNKADTFALQELYPLKEVQFETNTLPFALPHEWTDSEKDSLLSLLQNEFSNKSNSLYKQIKQLAKEEYARNNLEATMPIDQNTYVDLTSYIIGRKFSIIKKGAYKEQSFITLSEKGKSFDKVFQWVNEGTKNIYLSLEKIRQEELKQYEQQLSRSVQNDDSHLPRKQRARSATRYSIGEQVTFEDLGVGELLGGRRISDTPNQSTPAIESASRGTQERLREISTDKQSNSHGNAGRNAGDYDSEGSRTNRTSESTKPRILHQQEIVTPDVPAETEVFGGSKARYRVNIEAIQTLKQVKEEKRPATANEIAIMKKYLGWGGIPEAFDEHKKAWEKEYQELFSLLSEKEYEQARRSTLNAHYTQSDVIKAMYSAIDEMGFTGGKILDPSAGNGRFFSSLPSHWENELYAVEIDSISGNLTRAIHPDAKVSIMGYQNASYADNSFDAVISNIPFGDYKVPDKKYDKLGLSIHEYFFAKSLDKVKEGGLIAFITSKYVLDKKDSHFRQYLADRAELIGAVRLPKNSFSSIANTEVTTDILFLQKKESEAGSEREWTTLSTTTEGVPVNQYYVSHSDSLLGEMVFDKSFFGNEKDTACIAKEPDFVLANELNQALSVIAQENKGVFTNLKEKSNTFTIKEEQVTKEELVAAASLPADSNVKNFTYTLQGGFLYYRDGETLLLQELPATMHKCIAGMVNIRDSLRTLIDLQKENSNDEMFKDQQEKLNHLYDDFVNQYGILRSRENDRAFFADIDRPLIQALEEPAGENIYKKASIFSKRTISPKKEFVINSPNDALIASLNAKGVVDLPFMSAALHIDENEIVAALQDKIYLDPLSNKYVPADEYLSGNIQEKLTVLESFLEEAPELKRNQSALKEALPAPLSIGEISYDLATSWIPQKYKLQFLQETLKIMKLDFENVTLFQDKFSTEFKLRNTRQARSSCYILASEVYGTARKNAFSIFTDCLNFKICTVYDTVRDDDDKEKRVLNVAETQIAREKQSVLQNEFISWVQLSPERVNDLENIYNQTINIYKPRKFDGSYLEIPNLSSEIELKPHQKDAVARIVFGGNTLLAHEVGAGKTYTMIAAALFGKHIGTVKKPLFVIPNHMLEQFTTDFYRLFPAGNLLVPTDKDFEKTNRQRFISRIAVSEYDAIIITFSQFEKIPMSPEYRAEEIKSEIKSIVETISSSSDSKHYSVKQLEKTKAKLETKLETLYDETKKDDVIYFEQLGVDQLFVDEAHNYKNCFVHTKIQNVAGLGTSRAEKSFDMLLKTRYINYTTNYRGVVFSTGTPVSNSLSELFVMQRYLQNNILAASNMEHFDQWASTFAKIESVLEIAPEGTGFRDRTRFTTFYNLPQLITMFHMFADVKLIEDLEIERPSIETGKPQVIVCEPSEYVTAYIQELAVRAKRIRDGGVSPNEDNMLLVTTNGRNVAIDPSLVDPHAPQTKDSKIYTTCDNVAKIYHEYTQEKGVQLVFLDVGISLYGVMKQELIEKGISENEIAFIHSAKTDKQKADLFAKCRAGEIRVLFGSTAKMGAGTNVQDRLIALHNVDCPWRPSDLEQRSGRILRQGNSFPEVKIFNYITKGTFDSYLFQTIENKQRGISQIMTNKSPLRSCSDIDEAVLNYSDIKALASGDPRIKEKMELDNLVNRLKLERTTFYSSQNRLKQTIESAPFKIGELETSIERISQDMKMIQKPKDFIIELGGRTVTKRAEAAPLLRAILPESFGEEPIIGSYAGFQLTAKKGAISPTVYLKGNFTYSTQLETSDIGNITRIENILNKIPIRKENFELDLLDLKNSLVAAQENYTEIFPKEQQLKDLQEKKTRLDFEIEQSMKEPTNAPSENIQGIEL